MKKYKDFVKQLNEQGLGGAFGGQVDDIHFSNEVAKADDGTVNLYNPNSLEAVDRLNAAMHFINQKPVLNPKERINEIKMALAHGGIDFDVNEVSIEEGETTVPARLYGGFIGMEDDGTFKNEDGFERKTGDKYGVTFSWSKNKGMWQLESMIAPM